MKLIINKKLNLYCLNHYLKYNSVFKNEIINFILESELIREDIYINEYEEFINIINSYNLNTINSYTIFNIPYYEKYLPIKQIRIYFKDSSNNSFFYINNNSEREYLQNDIENNKSEFSFNFQFIEVNEKYIFKERELIIKSIIKQKKIT